MENKINLELIFENGDYIYQKYKGTIEEAKKEFIDTYIKVGKNKFLKCVRCEEI